MGYPPNPHPYIHTYYVYQAGALYLYLLNHKYVDQIPSCWDTPSSGILLLPPTQGQGHPGLMAAGPSP